jgi:alkylhydroperoxidase/carboxymuconolactone decarboxylase family protein YurZ
MTMRTPKPTPPRAARKTSPAPRQASGNWNPDWESFAALDPAWTEKFIPLAMTPAVSGALDTRTVELIGIALAACGAPDAGMLRRHVRRALDSGATRGQIIAVLQLASLQGLRSLCVGAPILLEELASSPSRAPHAGARKSPAKEPA